MTLARSRQLAGLVASSAPAGGARRGDPVGVPSDLMGVLLFVVLLWPGFVYSAARERWLPERQLTPLREVVSIVAASLSSVVMVGVLAAGFWALWPSAGPDVRRLLFDRQAYLTAHYVSVFCWALGLLAMAIALAALAPVIRSSERVRGTRWLRRLSEPPDPSTMSAWWIAFSEYDPAEVEMHLGCSLDDGSYVSGVLHSFSRLASDVADRDVLLGPPLALRPAGAMEMHPLHRAGRMVVSARHIVTMTVSYVPATPAPQPAPPARATRSPVPGTHAGPDRSTIEHVSGSGVNTT